MPEEQQLKTIKKMINAGMYDEARAALMSIEHPLADQWLKKLNKISPPTYKMAMRNNAAIRKSHAKSKSKAKLKTKEFTALPDDEEDASSRGTIIVVMAVMIGIGVLLVAGAFMLTQQGDVEPVITTDNTGCGGQDWVNAIDGSFNELYRYNLWGMLYFDGLDGPLRIDEDLRDQEIKVLESRLLRIENTIAPECTNSAREKMIEAYEAQILATEILQPEDPIRAFGVFGKTLRLMQESASELIELGAQFRRIDGEAIDKVLDTDCPAFAYITRTMYVDNQFIVMALVDPQIQDLQSFYSFINDLSQQYYRVLDDPNVVSCLWESRNQFVEIIDSARSMFEAVLGADLNGIEHHYDRMNIAWDQFYVEIEKLGLDPLQFGAGVVIREEG